MAREDFEGQSGGGGLGSEPFIITVTDALFAESEKYSEAGGAGTLFCHWLGTTDYEPQPLLTMEGFHPSWALGAGWQTLDGGKTIQHPKGKAKLGRNYGKLSERIADITEPIANTPQDPIAGAKTPYAAATWVNTVWEMVEEEYEVQGKPYRRLMPTKFLGYVGATTAPAAAPAAAAAPATNNGLRDVLVSLAKGSATFQEFQLKALALPGVATDMALVQAVSTEAGIWAETR